MVLFTFYMTIIAKFLLQYNQKMNFFYDLL